VQQSRDPLKVVDERSICASVRLAKPRDVLAWNAPSNSAYFPLTPQEIGSASYEVHQAAARFIRVVREASREVGFVAESAEPLFDAFRIRAAKALGSPDVNKATVRSLAALNDPADILAAIFIQKSCVDVPGFNERTEAAGRAFIEAVSKANPMVVAWIAAAVAQVKPLPSR
jgi:hypothetical protein